MCSTKKINFQLDNFFSSLLFQGAHLSLEFFLGQNLIIKIITLGSITLCIFFLKILFFRSINPEKIYLSMMMISLVFLKRKILCKCESRKVVGYFCDCVPSLFLYRSFPFHVSFYQVFSEKIVHEILYSCEYIFLG